MNRAIFIGSIILQMLSIDINIVTLNETADFYGVIVAMDTKFYG